jgi:uncharacterized protein involved in exopolysaccharide biosynthesis
VEPAIAPDRKSAPKWPLILGLFTFGGFFAGCFLAQFQWWKKRVQSDPERAMQLNGLRYALFGRPGTEA